MTTPVEGGPLDGRWLDVEDDVREVVVTMADGTRHRYVRSEDRDGTSGPVLRWSGRE